jgi:hypothetical protein
VIEDTIYHLNIPRFCCLSFRFATRTGDEEEHEKNDDDDKSIRSHDSTDLRREVGLIPKGTC